MTPIQLEVEDEEKRKKCCRLEPDGEVKKRADEFKYTHEQVEQIDKSLFTRLEIEKKARFNWRKVMTMIQLVKVLSKREADELKKKKDHDRDGEDHDSKKTDKFCDFKFLDRYL